MAASSCGVVAEVEDGDRLWRSAKNHPDWHTWDDDEQRWLPDGYTLRFNPDWSVSWADHLEEVHGLTAEAAAGSEHPLVYEAVASSARELGMLVTHTPEGSAPLGCAHTSVDYPGGVKPAKNERNKLRLALARRLERVHGDVSLPPPPGA